jgi:hypothetical protein
MVFASKLDEFGRPAWIAATVLGFWLFWPVGLAVLLFLAWSGRMRSWRGEKFGRWQTPQGQSSYNCGAWGRREAPSSGNRAFDEYRAETLRRLEEEQREFVDYLERLRQAKDKAEFDQFMAERRRPPTSTDVRDQP